MEALKGSEEWAVTQWGLVKLVHVKINASSRALTVEDLACRRKTIVVNMLENASAGHRPHGPRGLQASGLVAEGQE